MEVITTHIQADFDATASMLAAKLLHPEAVLVFSGSQEKGVRDYLMTAPKSVVADMVKLKTIDLDAVDRLIIVDTRQVSRIGAFADILGRDNLEIVIYDHHPPSPDDVKAHQEFCRELGSNVTLMTEILSSRSITPSPPVATLMAMGIYEDTGSLLFPSTMPEDCMALAKLLTWGADLNMVARMVSRELSPEQVDVLDQLIKNGRSLQIHGINILFTRSISSAYVEDFAMLVHKLRTMFVTDAMFALGQMGERIYLVARSALAQINAADVALFFGGGGHASAAAASIKNLTLDQAEHALIKHVKQEVKPRLRARDIMTFPVKGVRLDATIDETSDTLNKYNINAVIVKSKDERLLGYITRQIVTRAQGHNLGESKVKDYMVRDIKTVKPDAPMGEIRALIIDGNQRLLPVMEERRVMGVITRTDLMRAMHAKMEKIEGISRGTPLKKTVQSLLEERLPQGMYDLLIRAGELAVSLGYNIFLVGGIVRDMLLRIDNLDVDLVVEGDGITFAKEFARHTGARLASHDKYKTAVVSLPDGVHIDVATARLEYYKIPGGFPVVEESTLKLDLYRRDFTINTMAVALNPPRFGELIDFFGAQRDIKEKRIRVLHSLSFVEDPSRILRAIRFEKRYGFTLGKQTLSLVHSAVNAGFLRGIPGKRIFHEIRQILSEEDPVTCMERLKELGVLEAIHPALIFNPQAAESFQKAKKTISWFNLLYTHETIRSWFIYLLALTDQMKPKAIIAIAESLGFSGSEAREILSSKHTVLEIFRRFNTERDNSPAWMVGVLESASLEEILFAMSKTARADMQEMISTYITTWRHYKPPVAGKDLIAIGFSQDKYLGACLKTIRDRGLNGEIKDYSEAMALARTLLPRPDAP